MAKIYYRVNWSEKIIALEGNYEVPKVVNRVHTLDDPDKAKAFARDLRDNQDNCGLVYIEQFETLEF